MLLRKIIVDDDVVDLMFEITTLHTIVCFAENKLHLCEKVQILHDVQQTQLYLNIHAI